MRHSCHSPTTTVPFLRSAQDLPVVALVGNPNSGKSTLFNALTGSCAETAHYPGTTVEILTGLVPLGDRQIMLVDLPGLYTLRGGGEERQVVREVLRSGVDAVVAVVDATNLARHLYLVLELRSLGLPLVVALNMIDLLTSQEGRVDVKELERLLGVPVIPTIATTGQGVDKVVQKVLSITSSPPPAVAFLGPELDDSIEKLGDALEGYPLPPGLSRLSVALLLLEGDPEVTSFFSSRPGMEGILQQVVETQERLEETLGMPLAVAIAAARHRVADHIAKQVVKPGVRRESWLWSLAISPRAGVFFLLGVLAILFTVLFWGGNFLSTLLSAGWAMAVSPFLQTAARAMFGEGVIGRTVLWGVDAGLLAALSVGIPYVLTFYILLAFLEDTGFLNAMAFLADRLMRSFGLHGRAIIPLVAGAGCNVPAIIGTRVLPTMRERTIASTLITLVPCSARTAVILGAVALSLGILPALALYLLVLGVIVLVGWGLGKVLPGQASPLVMEVFPFRRPVVRVLWRKTWARFREFLVVALPLVMVGSIVLGGLYESGLIWKLSRPLAPVVEGWLGLPAVAGLTLVFAVLRKELALQLLVALAIVRYGPGAESLRAFLNGRQIFVYALVNTLYIPCIATIAVLARELGWRRALLISTFTVALAVAIGGVANKLILWWGA
ncbi:MAG: ferrous iron transport protein B [Armatimonadota bacterium]|nr:ferrous iron transport protein B [Armatimonadota bacterium]